MAELLAQYDGIALCGSSGRSSGPDTAEWLPRKHEFARKILKLRRLVFLDSIHHHQQAVLQPDYLDWLCVGLLLSSVQHSELSEALTFSARVGFFSKLLDQSSLVAS